MLSGGKLDEIPEAPPPVVIETFRELVDKRLAEVAAAARQENAEVKESTRQEMAELREQVAETNRLVAEMAGKPRPSLIRRLFGG